MKALFELFRRFDARRIFGFIRRFGSMSRPKVKCYDLRSTRALRVEGDSSSSRTLNGWSGFLSTPSGWRTTYFRIRSRSSTEFLSALSGWRATPLQNRKTNGCGVFLSTPSGWRATAKTDKVFVCFCAKGRRICLFKTRKEKICRWRFKKDKFWVLIWCEGSGKSVCALASHCG